MCPRHEWPRREELLERLEGHPCDRKSVEVCVTYSGSPSKNAPHTLNGLETTCFPNSEGPGEDVKPFLPRFLLQDIIFAHCPVDDLYPNQLRLRGNLLCRMDWLHRGIARTEGAILPIREIAACPRCSTCEHPGSGERPTARRSLPAPEPMNEFSWWPGPMPWNCKQR